MKLDTTLLAPDLAAMATYTAAAEAIGFDGLWASETKHDPFLPLVLAAEHSRRLTLGTGIAVAFPRSPTTLAHLAWDLARYSQGRFILGLGPQVWAHNERRFGVKWEKPIRKMRETIEAMHAIWDAWQNDRPLRYRGEFFKLTLMTPFFSGGPLDYPPPPIYLAAVNKQMLTLAGNLGDGVFIHALHSVDYLRQLARPAIAQGAAQANRTPEAVTVSAALFVVPTDDPKPAGHYEAYVRQQLAFYMSTPAYRTVLALHGWEETGYQLSKLAQRGRWADMPALISDAMLDTFALSGPWGGLPGQIKTRYGDMLDRVTYYLPFEPGPSEAGWRATIAGFRSL